jgi:hypothetical protein
MAGTSSSSAPTMLTTRHTSGSSDAAGRGRLPTDSQPNSGLAAVSRFGIKRRGVVHSVAAEGTC